MDIAYIFTARLIELVPNLTKFLANKIMNFATPFGFDTIFPDFEIIKFGPASEVLKSSCNELRDDGLISINYIHIVPEPLKLLLFNKKYSSYIITEKFDPLIKRIESFLVSSLKCEFRDIELASTIIHLCYVERFDTISDIIDGVYLHKDETRFPKDKIRLMIQILNQNKWLYSSGGKIFLEDPLKFANKLKRQVLKYSKREYYKIKELDITFFIENYKNIQKFLYSKKKNFSITAGNIFS